jgi:hypothetical protein
MSVPNLIFLAAGVPNPSGFPFNRCTFDLKDGTKFSLNESEMKIATQYIASEGVKELYEYANTQLLTAIDGSKSTKESNITSINFPINGTV